MSPNPKSIYIFSGKRKSGKDYVTDRLYDKLVSFLNYFHPQRQKIHYYFIYDLEIEYISKKLYFFRLNHDNVVIIKLSAPIKSLHAEKNDLDLKDLMSSFEYKEAHRKAMVEWSEKLRNEDYGVFCRAAIEMSKGMIIFTHVFTSLIFHHSK